MATKNQDFEMWQGEDKELVFSVTDVDDLSGASAEWRMAEDIYQPAKLTKSGSVDSGAVTVTVLLTPADTQSLRSGTWKHQLRVIDSSGKRNKAAEGTVVLHRVIPDSS